MTHTHPGFSARTKRGYAMKTPATGIFTAAMIFSAIHFSFAASLDGTVYHDADLSARSFYEQSLEDIDAPLPNVPMLLLGPDGEMQAETNEDGIFTFDDLLAAADGDSDDDNDACCG